MSEPDCATKPLNRRVIRFHGPAQSMELVVMYFTRYTFSYVGYMTATTQQRNVTVFLPGLWGVSNVTTRL